ncbi:hypothetical protein, partial [Gallibacterium anatis]|uniref:hypothetical protein n=1 Tax=Gallibacterium anatis TaxID=750 RepID=UPI00057EFFE1
MLDRSFFMYLTLMLSISFNVFAKDEDAHGDEIQDPYDCAPCERLKLIDAILGVNTLEQVVTDPKDPYRQLDFYRDYVLNYIPGEENKNKNDPEVVKKIEEFVKEKTKIGKLESNIGKNTTSITDHTNAIDAN